MFRRLFPFLFAALLLNAQVETPRPVDLSVGRLTLPSAEKVNDFSVAVRVSSDSAPAIWLEAEDLRFSLQSDGKIHFSYGKAAMSAILPAGAARSVILSVKRDARQSLSGLWVDGVELVTCQVAPGSLSLQGAKSSGEPALFARALTRPEILEWGLSQTEPEGLAVVGGTEAVALVESGYFEAMWPTAPRLRSLAWEGDTALRQDRPLNFGSLDQQLKRVNPKSVMLFFGRQECLESGNSGVETFVGRLTEQLGQWKLGGSIIGPVPFEKRSPPLPDLSALNDALSSYNEALKQVAAEKQMQFVDVITAWPKGATDLTRDGLTLTDKGCRTLAAIIVQHIAGAPLDPPDPLVLRLVQEKNLLWKDYWRPANWAFLYGDRTGQPSSRDHMDPTVRWFPQELEHYRTLITQKENELWKRRDELGRKLP